MSGLDKVIEEIAPGYAARKKAAAEKKDAASDKKEETAKEQEEPKKRRRRVAKKADGQTGQEGLMNERMYTIKLVGSIGLSGYQLQPGEKLMIAKLTPIPVEV